MTEADIEQNELSEISVKQYRRDPNNSGGGTQSFSIPPTVFIILHICCSSLRLRWSQLAPPWRFLIYYLEHH